MPASNHRQVINYREETQSPTFDLIASILSRRQKWLGYILRSEEAFLARRVLLGEVKEHKEKGLEYKHRSPISLSEAPSHESREDLVEAAEYRDEWRFWTWLGHWAGQGGGPAMKDKGPSASWMNGRIRTLPQGRSVA